MHFDYWILYESTVFKNIKVGRTSSDESIGQNNFGVFNKQQTTPGRGTGINGRKEERRETQRGETCITVQVWIELKFSKQLKKEKFGDAHKNSFNLILGVHHKQLTRYQGL